MPRSEKKREPEPRFPSSQEWQDKHVSHVRNPAYAPYNFVPLNREVVEVNPTVPPFEKNKYYTNRNGTKVYTGWIEVKIEALTPLYIRGTLTEEEVEAGLESKNKPDFFAPAGRIRIPGSSVRGLVRNMVEMVSFGRFHFFDEDRRLYYRGLADRSNLRSEYQSRMSSYNSRTRSTTYKMNAGYLFRDGLKYGIIPAQTRGGEQFERIKKAVTRQRFNDGKPISFENYTFFDHKGSAVVISGNMPNKKHDWEVYPPVENPKATIWLDESDIRDYYSDENRNAVNLIKVLENDRKLKLPCFYVLWTTDEKQERVSFGHTAMFRLAYEKTLGEHVIGQLKNNGKIDFADVVFGNEKTFAGRVFFEDAFLTDPQSTPEMDEETPQILSMPKPTTFQHYLIQNSDEVRQLNHYNSNAAIRGHKFYWHKSGKNWIETDKQAIDKDGTQYTKIKPVEPKTKFSGRIRFENLSDKELGALLFALDLPEGCAHKLGMGKPLGLGSVRVTPRLYLSDREKRYKNFFAECWDNKIEALDAGELWNIKVELEKYVLHKLGENSDKRLWETERLRELLVMLRVDVGKELERIGANDYMKLELRNEFKNRYVLPQASRIAPDSAVEDILTQLRNEPKPHFKETADTEHDVVVDEHIKSEIERGEITRMSERILITGAGSGFGRGAAFELARRGREVIASTETEEQAAEPRASSRKEGVTPRVEKLDIRDENDRTRAEEWGR